MRFLLEVCAASRSLQTTLTALGHDVLSAVEHAPRATAEELLVLERVEERILITEDKDFVVPGVAREGVVVGRAGDVLEAEQGVVLGVAAIDRAAVRLTITAAVEPA